MRHYIWILLLVAGWAQATTHAFDTDYKKAQHNVLLSWTCDDRTDSQFVHLAVEYGFKMTFSPYRNFVTDVNDDFASHDPYYDEWCIGYARSQGMDFGIHAQPNAVTILNSFGRDSVRAIWDSETAFVRKWGGLTKQFPGFVWVGHNNNPELRAMARQYGFLWTRGLTGSKNADLYLNGGGWSNEAGGAGFYPPIMYHRAVITSCSMYRLNTAGSSFLHGSTTADTTGWWGGTHAFLDSLSRKNGVAILNVHPGWTGSHRETDSQGSTFARTVVVPNGNTIIFDGRQGNTGRNDVSAYQIAYILEAMAHWDSLKVNTEGAKRICMLPMSQLMTHPDLPWRTDNSADPDLVLENAWSSADSIATPYAVFAGDPALTPKEEFKVYVDASGTVKAGNGTAEAPLPFGAFKYLFNCTVEFVGHAPGGFRTIPYGTELRSGNVIYNLNGLTLKPTGTPGVWLKYMDASSSAHYIRDVTWQNGTFDFGASTSWGISLGDATTYSSASYRPARVKFKGITFKNGKQDLYLQNVYQPEVDSCFFEGISGLASTYFLSGGYQLYYPVIRNCVFDLSAVGNSSWVMDCGSHATTNIAWQDSIAFLNNIIKTGTGTHYLLRMPPDAALAAPMRSQIRLEGNYIVSNKAASPTTLLSHATLTTLASLATRISTDAPTFNWRRVNYEPGAHTAFDPRTAVNDTLRWGGFTGPGSRATSQFAAIGAGSAAVPPQITLGTAARDAGVPDYAQLNLYQVARLAADRVVICDSLNTDTWIRVEAPVTPAEQAQAALVRQMYQDMPLATRQKLKLNFLN